jgi:hypothetical protein
MGKSMHKDDVIFGGDKTYKLNGFNSWSEAKKAVAEQIGPKQTPMWSQAESALKGWQKEDAMADAYVKIGVVDGVLLLRAKSKRFLGDEERDAVLLKGYKIAAAAWAKEQDQGTSQHLSGREIIARELKDVKKREDAYKVLKSLGANDTHLALLVDDAAVTKLLKAVRVPEDDIPGIVRSKVLINDPQVAVNALIAAIDRTNDGKMLSKLVQKLGVSASLLNGLAQGVSNEVVAKELVALGVKPRRAEEVSMILLDAETPDEKAKRKLRDAAGVDEIIKRLVKLGIPQATAHDWGYGSGYSEEVIVKAVVAKGVDRSVATKIAQALLP